MRINVKPSKDLTEWHRWFAWHPVRADSQIVWLEWVQRRVYYWADGWQYEYHTVGRT